MSTTRPRPAAAPPTVTIVVLPLAALPYAIMMANLGGLHDTDGISRGLAAVFAVVGIVILWSMLTVLLVNAAIAEAMPGWARIAALVLHPLSFAAAIMALRLLDADREHGWAVVAPALLPPLLGAYALWARPPQLHRRLAPEPTSIAIWSAVLVLSLVPILGLVLR